MYLPSAFAEHDLRVLDAFADSFDFASLVTVADGNPFASHVPVLYSRDGAQVLIRGHLARANPQCGHAGDALLMLHGPHAYISPGWYPDKAEKARVPTWNYEVAHLSGALEFFDDEMMLAGLVSELTQRHEARVGGDWGFDFENPRERAQLRGIVGFRLRVERIAHKRKLGQNHPIANREAVARRLAGSPDPQARRLGAAVAATLLPAHGD
jgi:transcriptional regulator